jgi:hypothetical protein
MKSDEMDHYAHLCSAVKNNPLSVRNSMKQQRCGHVHGDYLSAHGHMKMKSVF